MFGSGSRAGHKQQTASQVPLRVSAWGRVPVVGESHYQAVLKKAVGGRVAGPGFAGVRTTTTLIPEPGNPHDRHAVRVDVAGGTVGYLPRHHAVEYQEPLLAATSRGYVPWCPAQITGGGDRHYGIYLHLAPSERLLFANDPSGLELLDADDMIVVSGSKDCAEVAARYRPQTRIVTVLDFCPVPSGKYKGQRAVQVTLDGRRLGQLTPTMSQRYAGYVTAAYQRGEVPGSEALVEDDGRVQVLMPQEARRQERTSGL